jgi:hypothetical protein
MEHNLSTLKDYINSIDYVLVKTRFSSKMMNTDEFTNKHSDNIISEYLHGIRNYYDIPRGTIMFDKENKFLFECANIKNMIDYDLIPLKYTNIDESKIYKIKRSNNDIQECKLISNYSIFICGKGILRITCHFDCLNESKKIYETYYKSVHLIDFLELNNIELLEITKPIIVSNYDSIASPLYNEIKNYYYNLLNDFYNKIQGKFNDLNINIKINNL